jgi:hypothetical protein
MSQASGIRLRQHSPLAVGDLRAEGARCLQVCGRPLVFAAVSVVLVVVGIRVRILIRAGASPSSLLREAGWGRARRGEGREAQFRKIGSEKESSRSYSDCGEVGLQRDRPQGGGIAGADESAEQAAVPPARGCASLRPVLQMHPLGDPGWITNGRGFMRIGLHQDEHPGLQMSVCVCGGARCTKTFF